MARALVRFGWPSTLARTGNGREQRGCRIIITAVQDRHCPTPCNINSKTWRRRRPASLASCLSLAAASVGGTGNRADAVLQELLCTRAGSGWDGPSTSYGHPPRSPRHLQSQTRSNVALWRAGLVLGARVIRDADRCRCRSRSTKPPPNGSCGQQGGLRGSSTPWRRGGQGLKGLSASPGLHPRSDRRTRGQISFLARREGRRRRLRASN